MKQPGMAHEDLKSLTDEETRRIVRDVIKEEVTKRIEEAVEQVLRAAILSAESGFW